MSVRSQLEESFKENGRLREENKQLVRLLMEQIGKQLDKAEDESEKATNELCKN